MSFIKISYNIYIKNEKCSTENRKVNITQKPCPIAIDVHVYLIWKTTCIKCRRECVNVKDINAQTSYDGRGFT